MSVSKAAILEALGNVQEPDLKKDSLHLYPNYQTHHINKALSNGTVGLWLKKMPMKEYSPLVVPVPFQRNQNNTLTSSVNEGNNNNLGGLNLVGLR